MKINKLMMFVSIVLVSLFIIGAASAADVVDDTAADDTLAVDEVDDVVAADGDEGTFTDLRKDIEGQTTVELNKDYKYNSSVDTLADKAIDVMDDESIKVYVNNTERYTYGVHIINNCTIDGKGHYIDGADMATIFVIDAGNTVTLKNIAFKNSDVAIYSCGDLTLENCTFENVTFPFEDVLEVPYFALIDDDDSYDDQLNNPGSALSMYYYKFPRADSYTWDGKRDYENYSAITIEHEFDATAATQFPWIAIYVGDFVGNVSVVYDGKNIFNYTLDAPKYLGYLIISVPTDCNLPEYALNENHTKPTYGNGTEISMDPTKLIVQFTDSEGTVDFTYDDTIEGGETIMETNLNVVADVAEDGTIIAIATIDQYATGSITFTLLNATGDIIDFEIDDIDDGVAMGELYTEQKGIYTVVATFTGDEYHAASEKNTTVEINKDYVVWNITTSELLNYTIFSVVLPADATGNVTLLNTNTTRSISNGTATFFAQFEAGNQTALFLYEGDAKYYGDSETFEFFIKENANLKTNITVNDFGMIIVDATVEKSATGNITFYIVDAANNFTIIVNETYEIVNGTASFDEMAQFAKGTYIVSTSYSGDNYYKSGSTFGLANVTKTVPVVNDTVEVTANQAKITFTFPADATGNVTIYFLSYGSNATYPITNGTVVVDEIFDNGNQSVLLGYDGDANYYGVFDYYVDFFVKTSSFIKVQSKVSVVYNKNAKVTVTLTDNDDGKGNNPIAKAEVTIKVAGKTFKAKTDAKGKAVFTIPAKFTPKTYTATVSYKGTATCYGDSDSFKLVVKKATPKITAKKKTFKAKKKTKKYTITLKDNKGKAIKKAKVTLKVKGKTYKAKTNKKGKATFKITKLNKKGTHKAKITYKGNKLFKKATKSVKIKVK